jgi:hypothetical protein
VGRLAEALAATPVRNFWISIDSAVPEVHERMRGFPGVIRGIEKALPLFHANGLFPSANLGINRNIGGEETRTLCRQAYSSERAYLDAFRRRFRRAFGRFYRFVEDMGFTMVNTCYPMSIDENEEDRGLSAVYAATAQGDVIRFGRAEKGALFHALLETVPEHRTRMRIFSPLCSLYALHRCYNGNGEGVPSYPCRGGIDFFFVDARDGGAYPCGYRGREKLGPLCDLAKTPPHPGGAACTRCDWECFRDPSELFGPILDGMHRPLALLHRLRRDPRFFRYWFSDLSYYRACDFFDGRRPPRL